jgi:hypothetical protein
VLKVINEYLELRVKQYEDGMIEVYDAIGDERKESESWQEIKDWIINLLDNMENECPECGAKI